MLASLLFTAVFGHATTFSCEVLLGKNKTIAADVPRAVDPDRPPIPVPDVETITGCQGDRRHERHRPGTWFSTPPLEPGGAPYWVIYEPDDGSDVTRLLDDVKTKASFVRQYLYRVAVVKRALGATDAIDVPVFALRNLVRGKSTSPRMLRVEFGIGSDGGGLMFVRRAAPVSLAEVMMSTAAYAQDHARPAEVITIGEGAARIDVHVPHVLRAIDIDPGLTFAKLKNAVTRAADLSPQLLEHLRDLPAGGRLIGRIGDEAHALAGTIRFERTKHGCTMIFGKNARGGIDLLAWLYAAVI